ncbi:hypothetical protein PILCRDRAFT_726059 [Piloderma croceum F 1598]|uniref:Uncharacterized protein n=1 Tax=Piloderma croceum (strain F 1598) TaxID=765440 RepID=A0A0C3B854_PILCF|nr:hypothetical protein PILCRDRAFT_726059 [Piloderma croceum F 1598]
MTKRLNIRRSRSAIQGANTETTPRASAHKLRSIYIPLNLFKTAGEVNTPNTPPRMQQALPCPNRVLSAKQVSKLASTGISMIGPGRCPYFNNVNAIIFLGPISCFVE